jgi:hypothetical protein
LDKAGVLSLLVCILISALIYEVPLGIVPIQTCSLSSIPMPGTRLGSYAFAGETSGLLFLIEDALRTRFP